MRPGVIVGVLCGVVIGAVVTFLIVRRSGPAAPGAPESTAGPATAQEAPRHPIVGTWQIKIEMITASYRFENDGRFTLTFEIPGPRRDGTPHNVTGTWRVEKSNRVGGTGEQLVMLNQTSTTPLSVVGEQESAPIVSIGPDSFVLKNLNRKGVEELLTFTRVRPFVAGSRGEQAIVGSWKCNAYQLDLKSSGDLMMITSQSERAGKWSLEGDTLRLLIDPAPVRSAARRQADPSLTQPREVKYEIIWTADRGTFTLRPTDLPGQNSITFRRLGADEALPRPSPNSSRK
jgi:hypothetical protein